MLLMIKGMAFPYVLSPFNSSSCLSLQSGDSSLGQTRHPIGYSAGCKPLLFTDGASPSKENSLQVATDSPSTTQGETHTQMHIQAC